MFKFLRSPWLLAASLGGGSFAFVINNTNYNSYENKQFKRGKNIPKPKKVVKSVIFDFDGVIVDSETIFYKANVEACNRFGGEYTLDIKHAQMGRSLSDAVECVLRRTGLAEKQITEEEYLYVYNKYLDKLLPEMKLRPGARRLIEHLQKNGIQTCICTSSSSEEFAKKIDECEDLVKKMDTVVLAGDDIEVEVTMRRMKPPPKNPSEVLVFEDSINGVKSALSAGCTVIWVPQQDSEITNWGGQEATERKFHRYSNFAETILSLNDFDPVKYGLPQYVEKKGGNN